MSSVGLTKLIEKIRESCHSDKQMEEFLIKLVYEEANSSGKKWYKDEYKKKIEQFAKEWRGSSED